MSRREAHNMIRRRATAAGIYAPVSCHSFRATGITIYLENGGTLETAQKIAAWITADNQTLRSDKWSANAGRDRAHCNLIVKSKHQHRVRISVLWRFPRIWRTTALDLAYKQSLTDRNGTRRLRSLSGLAGSNDSPQRHVSMPASASPATSVRLVPEPTHARRPITGRLVWARGESR